MIRYHTNAVQRISIALATGIIVLFATCLLLPAELMAQDEPIQVAVEAYNNAEFDRATDLFTEIAESPNAPVKQRVEAYKYLARLYVAQDMQDEARDAMSKLLDLEPPLAEFDPREERLDLLHVYYDVRREKTGGFEVEKANDQIRTVAIFDMENYSIGDARTEYELLGAHLATKMINFLHGSVDLKVIERERLSYILDELELQRRADVVDQQTAVRIGKMLGAQSMIFGNFAVIDDDVDIGVRMVDVETSEIILGTSVDGDVDDIFELTKELSLNLAEAINASLDEKAIAQAGETKSLEASLAYQQGIALLEDNQRAEAYGKFQEALEIDPDYAQAALRATSLQHNLN